MAAPAWALTLTYAFHILATVVWIGGLAALVLLVIPSARRSLSSDAFRALLGQLQPRIQTVGWFSLLVLIGTGMLQMSSAPAYKGFLAIENNWSVAILLKHLVVGVMVLISMYFTWGLLPEIQRTAVLKSAGKAMDPMVSLRLENRENLLMRLNLALAVIVLVLTAWARAS